MKEKFKKDDRVMVENLVSGVAMPYRGQSGTVTSVHALPQIHVHLDSGQDIVLLEMDLKLGAMKPQLVEMRRTPVPALTKEGIGKLERLIRETCAKS